jgi:hypothetical protein
VCEREREREKKRERERERERDRDRDSYKERETEKRGRETETERQETETETDRDRQRQTERETETERDTETPGRRLESIPKAAARLDIEVKCFHHRRRTRCGARRRWGWRCCASCSPRTKRNSLLHSERNEPIQCGLTPGCVTHPSRSRKFIVEAIQGHVVTTSGEQCAHFLRLLTRLCRADPSALVEFVPQLKEALEYITFLRWPAHATRHLLLSGLEA